MTPVPKWGPRLARLYSADARGGEADNCGLVVDDDVPFSDFRR